MAINGSVRWLLTLVARMLEQYDAQLADAWEPFLADDAELPSRA